MATQRNLLTMTIAPRALTFVALCAGGGDFGPGQHKQLPTVWSSPPPNLTIVAFGGETITPVLEKNLILRERQEIEPGTMQAMLSRANVLIA